MNYFRISFKNLSLSFLFLTVSLGNAQQPATPRPREFPRGAINRLQDLPESRLRTRIDKLPALARTRAIENLHNFHFTESDLPSLEVDAQGGILYVDEFEVPVAGAANPVSSSEPVTSEAARAGTIPAHLVFHSKPGSANVIYLNFMGEIVSGTAWNTTALPEISAVAFSTDSDFTTFNDAEQIAIKRIWQRVAEDFAPFDVNVTTQRPSTFGPRTAHALITRNTDANGNGNPYSGAAGVAYVNVFGGSNYQNYQPAWIYHNNLGSGESLVAEAASHEIGHNFGLSHDGIEGGSYYGGHGDGSTSWGPIMGSPYGRNVSQWSKGEYYLANNTQDDLATISAKIPYRTDDCGNTSGTAKPLVITVTNIISTTPENDPSNTNLANKGILDRSTDVDVFSFVTGNGPIHLTVEPWIGPAGPKGGNVDLLLELYNASGTRIMTNNPSDETFAQIQTTLAKGTYYLFIRSVGTGDPQSSNPTGYKSYASAGQYFIKGFITPESAIAVPVELTATVNDPDLGSVSPSEASYTIGSTAQVLATAAPYYQFAGWTIGASGTNNPLTLVMTTNVSVQAFFTERLTTNYPTPHWWLADHGYFNFESAVSTIGANGIPVWQSYVAGLNPNNPNIQLRVSISGNVLSWNPVADRVYTILSSTNINAGFVALPQAIDLPATTQSFTNPIAPTQKATFYKLSVRKN